MIFAQFKELTHKYDSRTTAGVKDLSFNLFRRKVTTLIGPSGSGKTTTLKLINNELDLHSGEILFKEKESIAYVNQFPNLDEDSTVLEILIKELDHLDHSEQRENQARTVIARLELTNEINSKIKDISGGQRQRVVIAKALVKNPTLLLLDEPFANLDKTLRLEILNDLFTLFKEEEMTILWVTHNTEEALSYSDHLVLLNFGEMQAQGSPKELYQKSPNLFTANFFGEVNLIAAKVEDSSLDEISFKLENKSIIVKKSKALIKEHKDILLMIRPELIHIQEDGPFTAKVISSSFKGAHCLVEAQTNERTYYLYALPFQDFKDGDAIKFGIDFLHSHYLTEI